MPTGRYHAALAFLKIGQIGGGRIAQTQAIAALQSDRWEIISGALSSDPVLSCDKAIEWQIDPARAYLSFQEMAQAEAQRPDAIDAVMTTTQPICISQPQKCF